MRVPKRVRQALHILREEGYAGSYTIEFTDGGPGAQEDIETLWGNAVRDLEFLRSNLE